MEDLLVFVLSGLVSGALYALLATGLVLSYSASGLFNFAHGATAYLCALTFYELHSGLGGPAVTAALLVVCVLAPGLGWGLDRLMFRRLARVGESAQIVATIGLLVALPAAGLWTVELLGIAICAIVWLFTRQLTPWLVYTLTALALIGLFLALSPFAARRR